MRLRCKHIACNMAGRDILRGVTFSAMPGGVTAIIGPNGAGKTTLLRTLALLQRPDSGEIFLDNISALNNPQSIRRNISMVFQQPVLLDRSVEDNIAFGLKARSANTIREQINYAIDMLGLDRIRRRNARALSGGEKRRAAIAMALALDTPVLLLDESLANLDSFSATTVRRLLETLKEESSKTIVLATHDLDSARRYADFVYLMQDGLIAQSGDAEELFERPSSAFAAHYLGSPNTYEGVIETENEVRYVRLFCGLRIATGSHAEGRVRVYIPPSDIIISVSPFRSSALNVFRGRIKSISVADGLARITVDIGVDVEATLTTRSLEAFGLRVDSEVYLTWKATAVQITKEELV